MEQLASTSEPLWGEIKLDHCQLCPQNFGVLTDEVIDQLRTTFPNTRFRLHANVRIPGHKRSGRTLGDIEGDALLYYQALSRINHSLCGQPYTLHPGRKDSLLQLLENSNRLTDLFGVPVGIEGMYPGYAIGAWADYLWLLNSGAYYALDLSHLNIVVHREKKQELSLLSELIHSDKCLEIHVSGNNGLKDHHALLEETPWWYETLCSAYPDSNAILFTEGNQIHKKY
nr:hypothetical protein [Methylomarinum sp. Ch1-1]MDP4523314.1 hypothetical protein [Methylomarinum sp. Ch1-1]